VVLDQSIKQLHCKINYLCRILAVFNALLMAFVVNTQQETKHEIIEP